MRADGSQHWLFPSTHQNDFRYPFQSIQVVSAASLVSLELDRLAFGSYQLRTSDKPLKSSGPSPLICVIGIIVITNLQSAYKDYRQPLIMPAWLWAQSKNLKVGVPEL